MPATISATAVIFIFGGSLFGYAFFWVAIIGPGILLGMQNMLALNNRKLISFVISTALLPSMILTSSILQHSGIPDKVTLTLIYVISLYLITWGSTGKVPHSRSSLLVFGIGALATVIMQHLPPIKMELAFIAPVIIWQILATASICLVLRTDTTSKDC